MIILRKLGKQSSCRVILADTLSGQTDGQNQTFSVSNEYTPGRIEILYNGQVLTSPTDFEETGPQEITFVYLKPTDITVLRANYEMGDCGQEGGSSASNFLELEDTPYDYTSHGGKLVSVRDDETGLTFIDSFPITTNFLDLLDTPTTYSGFENRYVRVKATGDGLEFAVPCGDPQEGTLNIPDGVSNLDITFAEEFDDDTFVLIISLENRGDDHPSVFPTLIKNKSKSGFSVEFSGNIDSGNYYLNWRAASPCLEPATASGDIQDGIENIPTGVSSTEILFPHRFNTDDFVLTVSLENKLDAEPSVYPVIVKNRTVDGFTAEFSGNIDSENYYLNWRATLMGPGSYPLCGGITELSEDLSPELGADLNVGDHLVMLDPSPNGMSVHGYEIGYSGEASEMYVGDNPTGFACPLYMRPDGTWAAACAASGIYHMPCAALALEEDDGDVKKIFWKGIIRKGIWNWTPGSKIYVSTVEGALTSAKPNGGSWPQVIGIAISSDSIRFDPDLNSENPN